MISFGESALHNPLLERAVLSIRRRGKFDGPVMVITDADLRMYKDVFDEKVYFVNAKEKDFNRSFTSREYRIMSQLYCLTWSLYPVLLIHSFTFSHIFYAFNALGSLHILFIS